MPDEPETPLPDHDYDCACESEPVREDELLRFPCRFDTRKYPLVIIIPNRKTP